MTDVFISFGLAGNIQCSWYSVLSQAETKQNAFLSHSASNFTVAVNSEMLNCGEKNEAGWRKAALGTAEHKGHKG